MSAWTVGSGIGRRGTTTLAARDQGAAGDAPTVNTLVEWIPGEVIAAYMALVLALQADGSSGTPESTSLWWLVGAIVAAGVLTFLGGFSKRSGLGSEWLELGVRVVLSAAAFALWSLVLPGSWWQSIHDIADNAAVVAIVAGLAASAFGLLAQGIVQRLGSGAPADG
jgi:hypothetical protein